MILHFKLNIKGELFRPPVYYGEGSRKVSILHTWLRHKYNSLNANLNKINLVNYTKCSHGSRIEDAIHLRNRSWKPECVGSFNMDWRILVFYPEPEARDKIY
jgi:hypothetical protein